MRSNYADAADAAIGRIIDGITLTETPGHLLRRAQQRAVDLFVQAVGENGLRPPQFAVLVTVKQRPGLNQTQLVRATGIDRSTIADLLERLVGRGLLERRRDAGDQRMNTLWITAAGAAALEATAAAVAVVQDRIMAPVPPDLRATAIAVLKLLAELPAEPDESKEGDAP